MLCDYDGVSFYGASRKGCSCRTYWLAQELPSEDVCEPVPYTTY
jgi:hypothetical protein